MSDLLMERVPDVAAPADDAPGSVLAIIARAASNPNVNVEKMKELFVLHRDLLADQATREFNAAFARLSARMPRVKKNGRVTLIRKDGTDGGTYPFAKWEDIDRIIRPLLQEEGFALQFNSAPRQGDGGGLVVTGTLLHRDGHSATASMPLPLDTGPGRNNLQATGSTLSYGKRYVAEMLLNIVREGDDDDGVKGGAETISDAQVEELSKDMAAVGFQLGPMLDLLGVPSLQDIRKEQLAIARNAIKMRRDRKRQ